MKHSFWSNFVYIEEAGRVVFKLMIKVSITSTEISQHHVLPNMIPYFCGTAVKTCRLNNEEISKQSEIEGQSLKEAFSILEKPMFSWTSIFLFLSLKL